MRVEWSLELTLVEKHSKLFGLIAREFQMLAAGLVCSTAKNGHLRLPLSALVGPARSPPDRRDGRRSLRFVSNDPDAEPLVAFYKIPCYYFWTTSTDKADIEKDEIDLLLQNGVDFIVLARYIQIFDDAFLGEGLPRKDRRHA
jgi:hypothetical protein